VIDELAKRAGAGEAVSKVTEAAMRGELDFQASLRKRLSYLKGLSADVLEDIACNLPVTDGAARLMHTLRSLGYKTAILSGGFSYFGERLQRDLGIDYVHANVLEIVDGKLTGNVIGDIVDGAKKASLLREIAARENIRLEQTVAVGDGANDILMLQTAGLGIAFRAKPKLQEVADMSLNHNERRDTLLYLMGYNAPDLAQIG
jgi:phosphoserine phosphatase